MSLTMKDKVLAAQRCIDQRSEAMVATRKEHRLIHLGECSTKSGRQLQSETRNFRSVNAQSIADSTFRHEVPRSLRIRLELGTKIVDTHSKAAGVAQLRGAPNLAYQTILIDDAAGLPREILEHPEFEWREVNFSVSAVHFASRQIDDPLSEPNLQ
jgi:hypothetical protein